MPGARNEKRGEARPMNKETCRENCQFKTSVGGQALMEGIMMRGPEKIACAVRRPDGTLETMEEPVRHYFWQQIPLVRGVVNFVLYLSEVPYATSLLKIHPRLYCFLSFTSTTSFFISSRFTESFMR